MLRRFRTIIRNQRHQDIENVWNMIFVFYWLTMLDIEYVFIKAFFQRKNILLSCCITCFLFVCLSLFNRVFVLRKVVPLSDLIFVTVFFYINITSLSCTLVSLLYFYYLYWFYFLIFCFISFSVLCLGCNILYYCISF